MLCTTSSRSISAEPQNSVLGQQTLFVSLKIQASMTGWNGNCKYGSRHYLHCCVSWQAYHHDTSVLQFANTFQTVMHLGEENRF